MYIKIKNKKILTLLKTFQPLASSIKNRHYLVIHTVNFNKNHDDIYENL